MRKATAFLTSLVSYLSLSSIAFAETPINTCPEGAFGNLCKLTTGNFSQVFSKIITILFIIAVLIALAFLIYGGIKWILSGGDKAGVESARNHIVAAIVGLIIVLLSYFILNIILGFFGLSLTNIELPRLTF